jgi:hypothetical protein
MARNSRLKRDAMNLRRTAAPTRPALTYLHITRRSRKTAQPIGLPPRLRSRLRRRASGLFGLPLQARVADLLADAMLLIDEAIDMCETERGAPLEAARLATQIRSASDQVNLLMKTISD